MSKADDIVRLSQEGMKPGEIASELETSPSYVYKVRSQRDWNESGNGSSGSSGTDSSEPRSFDASTGETGPIGERTDADPEPEADRLELADDGPKEYDCGSCGEPVEYLQKTCDGCDEQLLWSRIE